MYKIEENDPVEPTIADCEAAKKTLKPFCLHASVDLVEYVALVIKSERTRVEARQNQELAELRERYPDALFQAEDLLRQVKLLESTLERAELACSEAMRKADDHRRQRDTAASLIARYQTDINRLEAHVEAAEPEIVICSAVRLPDGRLIRGQRHNHCIEAARTYIDYRYTIGLELKTYEELRPDLGPESQGFITSRNRYVTRAEGMQLQLNAGIKSVAEGGYRGTLFSEDLY